MSFLHRLAVAFGLRRPPVPPPLHRHALESILAFCCLRDLSVASRVCRDWNAAAHSMSSIAAPFAPRVPLARLLPSRLFTRHIGSLSNRALIGALADASDWALGVAALSSLAASPRLTVSLRELDWTVPRLPAVFSGATQVANTEWSELVLPSRLRKLTLNVKMKLRKADASALLTAIAQLSELKALSLSQLSSTDVFDFTPLMALAHLETLELTRSPHSHALSEHQITQLRSVAAVREDGLALQTLQLSPLDPKEFSYLLAPGHAMRLRTLDLLTCDLSDSSQLLTSLSASLTSLSLCFCGSSLDFLVELGVLHSLTLDLVGLPLSTSVAAVARGLHSRSSTLTELALTCWSEPCAEDMIALLLPLRSLTSLSLMHMPIASLGFFASLPALKSNLRCLHIAHCSAELSGADLAHLHGMHALETLTFILSRRSQLSIRQMATYSSPSADLPSLRVFRYWS